MIYGVDLGSRNISVFGLPELDEQILTPVAEHYTVPKSNRGQELQLLVEHLSKLVSSDGWLFVEEPPMVRNKRVFGQLSMTAGAMLAVSSRGYAVPVDDWKKGTVGRGGVGKAEVAEWLAATHPELSACCAGNQNLVDAACIALHGEVLRGPGT